AGGGGARPAEPGPGRRTGSRRGERRPAGGFSGRRPPNRALRRQALGREGRPAAARIAAQRGRADRDRRLRAGTGRARGGERRPRPLHRPPGAPPPRASLHAREGERDAFRVPGGVRHGRRGGGRFRLAAVGRKALGPGRDRRGPRGGVSARASRPRLVPKRRLRRPGSKAGNPACAPGPGLAPAVRCGAPSRRGALELGAHRGSDTFGAVGDAQRLRPDEQLRLAREQFEEGRDFTVAVEEEFAVLDPTTLSMTNRFEDLFAAAEGTELEGHLVGELISSEVEIRTGRSETFAEAAQTMAERRRQLAELAGRLGIALCATGTHPWSPWQEQNVIDTPHYRRAEEGLRYVAWRNNSFGIH